MRLFPTLQKISPNANLLYSCFPGNLTLNPPSEFHTGTVRYPSSSTGAISAWQKMAGTDPITGFPAPTGAPLFCSADSNAEGFGIYCIDDWYGLGNPGDAVSYAAVMDTGSEAATVRGANMYALKFIQKNHAENGYAATSLVQSHFTLQRNPAEVGFADLPVLCLQMYIKIPDQSSALSSTYRFRTIHDVKSLGDWRVVIHIIRADTTEYGVPVGTLGYAIAVDNNANGGLTFNEFIRMKSFDVSAPPPTDWHFAQLYIERSANYNDTTRGRIVYATKDINGVERTVFDITPSSVATYNIAHPKACNGNSPATDCVFHLMGINGAAIHRIFVLSNYHGGVAGVDVTSRIARLDVWDGYPGVLPPPAV